MASHRTVRRMAGLIVKYFSDELLQRVVDPRSARGRRWKTCLPLLRAVLLGLACGCRGLGELEELTEEMHTSVRRLVRIPKRIPDTTMRDFLCELDPRCLAEVLYLLAYDAWRRKALVACSDIPFGIFSLDGKYPTIRDIEPSAFNQIQHDESGAAVCGMIRTVTATMITAAGRPIMGAVPVPAETNEQGSFQQALGEMVRIYGRLFRVVMYDAGAASQANAEAVLKAGKHYFFQIADPNWVMYKTLATLLRDKAPVAVEEESEAEHKRVVRRMTMVTVRPTRKNLTVWGHVKTALRMDSETYENGELTGTLTRYYVTSLQNTQLTGEQWLRVIVMRWGVETSHQVLDVTFAEDARPWISSDAHGALAVMLLRRVAYTIMTLYRSVTQRSDENRQLPLRKLMEWLKDALKWPNGEEFADLRTRRFAVPPALA